MDTTRRGVTLGRVEWDRAFEIGIPLVDEQHHRLIDLINRLSDVLNGDAPDEAEIEHIVAGLIDYVGYHFSAEEELMDRFAVADAAIHKRQHQNFTKRVTAMRQETATDPKAMTDLAIFLQNWLISHVLTTDKRLGQQVAAKVGR